MAERQQVNRPRGALDFAVIGAGNGGTAMAGFLALKGFRVSLWNRSRPAVDSINSAGGILLEGEVTGLAAPDIATTDIEDAVAGASVIMVTVPASGHDAVARLLAPCLAGGQTVVLNPGRTGGALSFRKTLRDQGCRADAVVAETNTFIYASRRFEGGRSRVFGVKKSVSVSSLPAAAAPEVALKLKAAFPQFTPAENVMVTSFDNMGAVFHPVPTLLNAARVDRSLAFQHYTDGISRSVATVLEALDAERMAIARSMGVAARSALDWLRETYGIHAETLYEGIQANEAYRGIAAPTSLDTRYIKEDVPFSLVPMLSLAFLSGVSAPVMRSAVSLASALTGEDYMETGRNASSMGIAVTENAGAAGFSFSEVLIR